MSNKKPKHRSDHSSSPRSKAVADCKAALKELEQAALDCVNAEGMGRGRFWRDENFTKEVYNRAVEPFIQRYWKALQGWYDSVTVLAPMVDAALRVELLRLQGEVQAGIVDADPELAPKVEPTFIPEGPLSLAWRILHSIESQGAARDDGGKAGEPGEAIDDDSHLSPVKLAKIFRVDAEPLRKRLGRWRRPNNYNGWIENQDRKPNEAKYLYRVGAVRHIIDNLKTSSERPAKKK